jgi:hypothetical protein
MKKFVIIIFIILSLLAPFDNLMAQSFSFGSQGWISPIKDPVAILDYEVDWSKWLLGDVIIASAWTAPGLIIQATSFTSSATVIWLSGGNANQRYKVTNLITTSGGRVNEISFWLPVSFL